MTEILLYGEVGWEFDAGWLASALDGADDEVTLLVHSPGGDVFEGVAISNAIRRARAHGTRVVARVQGICASAASYMCLTADEVVAEPGSVFMVHPPSAVCAGTAGDMRETAQALDTCRDSIIDLYCRRTGRSPEEVDAVMGASTWMTAERAVEWGLADRVGDDAADLSDVDARWSAVRDSAEFAEFAAAHPALAERLDDYRAGSRRMAERMAEARESGFGPVEHASPSIPPKSEDDPDAAVEATAGGEGEAPSLAVANGHIYRIGNHRE